MDDARLPRDCGAPHGFGEGTGPVAAVGPGSVAEQAEGLRGAPVRAGAGNRDHLDVGVELLELLLPTQPVGTFRVVLEGHQYGLERVRKAGEEMVGADSSAGVERIGGATNGEDQPWGRGL